MNYSKVLRYLSKLNGANIVTPETYYSKIQTWLKWYQGYDETFHKIRVDNNVRVASRNISSLKMASQVARDCSSALMNDQFNITITGNINSTKNISSIFVQGSKKNGGVLKSNNFNSQMNQLIEKAFALGTGAVVVSVDNIVTDEYGNVQQSPNGKIVFDYLDATMIVPLRSRNNVIIDCAFVSEYQEDGRTYYSVSIHKLEQDGYVIYNKVLNTQMQETQNPIGVLPIIRTGSVKPWFQIIKPAIANNISLQSPMGVSVYADSIDVLKGIDVSYDNYVQEGVTGQRIVFMDRRLYRTDENGELVAPQDARSNYMLMVGAEVIANENEARVIKDFSPTLRFNEYNQALQEQLDLLSLKCGLGMGYYSFNNGTVAKTATEFTGSKQDFVRNFKKHSSLLSNAIENIVQAVLYIGKYILGANVNPDSKITVNLFDGIIVDDETLKANDRLDVQSGLMTKVEYRMKWYGDTEETAKQALNSIESINENDKNKPTANVKNNKTEDKNNKVDEEETVEEDKEGAV